MKTPKTFRLENYTCSRLAWLAAHLKTTETSVVELAITELHMRQFYNLPDFQLPHDQTPHCCRPIGEDCPCESFVVAGLDIVVKDCRARCCPYLVE